MAAVRSFRFSPVRGASTACSRMAMMSASPIPYADSTPASGWMRIFSMPRASATAQACWPPAPPNTLSRYPVTSYPRWTEIFLIALAMLATAISANPAATSSGPRVSPVAAAISALSAWNLLLVISLSRGWSPRGPKTFGK